MASRQMGTQSTTTNSKVMTQKNKPLSTFGRVSSYFPFIKTSSKTSSIGSSVGSEDNPEHRRIVHKKFVEWLLCLASGYFFDLRHILSFNTCQVCLMYMGLPTLRLDIDINKNE